MRIFAFLLVSSLIACNGHGDSDHEIGPLCEALGTACHDLGESGDADAQACHDLGHDGDEAACEAEYDACLEICAPA